jgi:hypothetical protein
MRTLESKYESVRTDFVNFGRENMSRPRYGIAQRGLLAGVDILERSGSDPDGPVAGLTALGCSAGS